MNFSDTFPYRVWMLCTNVVCFNVSIAGTFGQARSSWATCIHGVCSASGTLSRNASCRRRATRKKTAKTLRGVPLGSLRTALTSRSCRISAKTLIQATQPTTTPRFAGSTTQLSLRIASQSYHSTPRVPVSFVFVLCILNFRCSLQPGNLVLRAVAACLRWPHRLGHSSAHAPRSERTVNFAAIFKPA